MQNGAFCKAVRDFPSPVGHRERAHHCAHALTFQFGAAVPQEVEQREGQWFDPQVLQSASPSILEKNAKPQIAPDMSIEA